MQDIIEELTAKINVLDASCRQVKKALSDAGFSSVEEALAEIEQLRLQLEAAKSGEYASANLGGMLREAADMGINALKKLEEATKKETEHE